ncbi:MAG TPA: MFS transporter [Candidatus Atribacteria bacterium]|nr:MFS transporter [Candidatus Atribacteria bacterium]
MKIPKMLNHYTKLPKSIYILFFARMVNSMGAFVYPFLTIYLTKTLSLDEGEAGFIVMLAVTAHLPGLLVGGRLADWLGRKKILLLFQGLAAICLIPCAFLNNPFLIPRLLILSAFFHGAAQPASTAMTTDLTNPGNRKAAFSLLYLGGNIGFAVGPLIAGFLYNNYLMWIFLGDAGTTFASLTLVYLFVKETLPSKEEIEESFKLENNYGRAEKGNLWQVLWKRPALLLFTLISLIYSFVYSQMSFSIPIQVVELFGDKGPKIFGVIMTTNALVVSCLTIIIISLTHKIKPVLNVALAGVLYAIGFGMIFFITGLPWFLFSTVIWSIGEILVTTNTNVYIANHTPMSHRGRFNAVIPVVMGAGFALGPLISGDYIREYGIKNVWPMIFFLSLAATLFMYILYLSGKKKENKNIT